METLLPEWHKGYRRWVAPEVKEIVEKLHKGDPVLGWEGDPFLDLYWNPKTKRWMLLRWENGDFSIVMQSRPGLKLDHRLIQHLVEHDTRRGFNPMNAVELHNKMHLAEINRKFDDKLAEAADRVKHALHKDIGQHL